MKLISLADPIGLIMSGCKLLFAKMNTEYCFSVRKIQALTQPHTADGGLLPRTTDGNLCLQPWLPPSHTTRVSPLHPRPQRPAPGSIATAQAAVGAAQPSGGAMGQLQNRGKKGGTNRGRAVGMASLPAQGFITKNPNFVGRYNRRRKKEGEIDSTSLRV